MSAARRGGGGGFAVGGAARAPAGVLARGWAWLLVLCVLLAACGWPHRARAAEPAVDVAALGGQAQSLTAHFAVLEDPQGRWTLDDVRGAELAARFRSGQRPDWSLIFGVTTSTHWLRLTLRNGGAERFDGMVEFMFPRLAADVQMFQPEAGQGYRRHATGYYQPFSTRPYPHHFYVLPVAVPAQAEQVLYFRFQSPVKLEIPARLWTREAFHRYERLDYMGQAAYFGVVLVMVAFNLLLYLILRDLNYLLYVAFGVSTALALAAHNGLAYEYLWGHRYSVWTDAASTIGYSTSLAIGILFMRGMVATRQLVPRLDRLLRAAVALHLALPFALVADYGAFVRPALLIDGLSALAVWLVGLVCAWRGNRAARFFLIAFTVMSLGAVSVSMRSLELLPANVFSLYGIQIGSAIEMLLLAVALADRFHEMRKEKESAQREALQVQQRLVEHLRQQESVLEARVAERTEALQRLNHRLETLSATDGLTGIANRRHFDDRLAREWGRAARNGQPLAVALLDVDWFKPYNDHYGHQAGDECLRRIASVLESEVCRGGDLVARYGGEEFVFVAAGTTGERALEVAWRICRAVQALAQPHARSACGCVTVSVGVAAVVPLPGEEAGTLLQAADRALYRAKAEGRNRAVLDGPAPLPH